MRLIPDVGLFKQPKVELIPLEHNSWAIMEQNQNTNGSEYTILYTERNIPNSTILNNASKDFFCEEKIPKDLLRRS